MRSSSAGELRGKVVMIDRRVAEHLHLVFGGREDWAVVGGHAANLYRAEARFTVDTDVLISLGRRSMEDVAKTMVEAGWVVRSMPKGGWLLRVSHPLLGAVDVIASETDYQQHALARARVTGFDGVQLRVLSVEDVVIHKLIAARFKDEADVEDILRTDPDFDEDYLAKWIDEWGVRDRYERVVSRLAAPRRPTGGNPR